MKLSYKVAWILFLAFVFVSCSNELTDSQHVDNAERYIEAGELNTASISLKMPYGIIQTTPRLDGC